MAKSIQDSDMDLKNGTKNNSNVQLHIETRLDIIAIGHPKRLEGKKEQKSLLGKFWGENKQPDYTKSPY